ncbi:MAG: hypothetical protein HY973_02050 [Candidatus Kerfeldbacteria bacterium]|nr:hypothetical protein [Candidatus Kerfeldbacteria bacterium]
MRLLYQELYESLNNKQEALWFANIGALRQYIPEAITEYKKILRKIKNPKIRELNCGDTDGKHWLEEIKSFRGSHHQVRILPPNFKFGSTDNLILGNKLVIFSLAGDVSVIVIENKEIALTYRTLFEAAWSLGK